MTDANGVVVIRRGAYALCVTPSPFGPLLEADVLPGAEFQLMLDAALWLSTGLAPIGVAIGVPYD